MFQDSSPLSHSDDPGRAAPPTTRSALIVRQDAIDRGFNADEIKRKVARGEWTVLRPGTYLQARTVDGLGRAERHLLQIDAELPRTSEHAVVSHLSAACEHGLALIHEPGTTVQVTNPTGVTGHRRPLLHTFRASIEDDESVWLRGHQVTDVARTVVDVARTRPFDEGVAAADSALHQGLVTPSDLMAAVDRAPRRAGMRRARRVVMFADAGAESVGESRSRTLLAHERLPTPVIQFKVLSQGCVVAVSDFGWEEFNTVGEFDGAEKYGRLLIPGERAGDKVFQENMREDRIRDTGLVVVRWTWDDLKHPRDLAARIRRALHRGLALTQAHAAPQE